MYTAFVALRSHRWNVDMLHVAPYIPGNRQAAMLSVATTLWILQHFTRQLVVHGIEALVSTQSLQYRSVKECALSSSGHEKVYSKRTSHTLLVQDAMVSSHFEMSSSHSSGVLCFALADVNTAFTRDGFCVTAFSRAA